MAAFDVVRVDFELGFGVHLAAFGQQQVVIRLIGVSTIRAAVYNRLAIPDAARAAMQDAAVFLMRLSWADSMIDPGVI